MKDIYEKSKSFIYRNARPLDLARWQYHFENGGKKTVLKVLSAYQNPDGGFGHGLEADCFNPHSSPLQTWAATEILREIDFTDRSHPVIKGILDYLASDADFDNHHRQWLNTIPSNNDHPHAIWWTYQEGGDEFKYNPTACLAGFYLKYGDKDSEFYGTALQIAKEAYEHWAANMPYAEQHVTACYIRLYEYCLEAGAEIADMYEFRQKLNDQVAQELLSGANGWDTDYVCMPSHLIRTKDSICFERNAELVAKECEHISSSQLEDGSFTVPWQWWTDYKEFELAKNWWKSDITIKNMLLLREFQ